MAEHFKVAIIGSGPGGMSAAGRAAQTGVPHVLLEKTDHLSDTIYKYQKGKLVMATPEVLPLRSPMDFAMGIREDILGAWDRRTAELKVNVRFNAEATKIVRGDKGFTITVNGKETLTADAVVLAVGLQGNLRKLGVPGSDNHPRIQYQVDDPEEYSDETIVVVGAGDAAIENAVALAKQNRVTIINRSAEFARAKQGNLDLITKSIDKGVLECIYNAGPVKVDPVEDGRMNLVLKTAEGEARIVCDRIVARLGALAPRAFVEACGIVFPSKDPTALPELSPTYESNVKGLYVIGALAGYPLIKQAMNQGYEVVEFIQGNKLKPADEPLLEEKFKPLLDRFTVDELLTAIQKTIPVFSGLTVLQLREVLLGSDIHVPAAGDVVFQRNEFTNTFYTVFEGEVGIQIDPEDPDEMVRLGPGEFFGEMGLLSGRRRSATVVATQPAVLIETARREMIKLIKSVPQVQKAVDAAAIERQIRSYIAPNLSKPDMAQVLGTAKIRPFKAGQTLFSEGDPADGIYLIRNGSCTVAQRMAGREVVVSYIPAGNYVGEMALVRDRPRSATVKAAIDTDTVWLDSGNFRMLMDHLPELRHQVEKRIGAMIVTDEEISARPEAGSLIEALVNEGAKEAADMLLIDESLCIRCDNCEKACAETHGGVSRLDREAGPTFASIHVPTSCRHCAHPHCMSNCPADAIHKSKDGEVFIDEKCIGCGNCERDCPYGVIHMAYEAPEKPGLLSWLLFGLGSGPGEDKEAAHGAHHGAKLAVKCDLCKDIDGGAACVRSCPTGAAIRVRPEQFFSLITSSGP
jgi:CRP-like cAMP-binding protein/Fe-S-cluster-containing hydrogenase component 2/thioredoxin reductase